jgi:hypothetical protein
MRKRVNKKEYSEVEERDEKELRGGRRYSKKFSFLWEYNSWFSGLKTETSNFLLRSL